MTLHQNRNAVPRAPCQWHTIFVLEELDQVIGLGLYPTFHAFIPHSKFPERCNSKTSLMFPDETI